MRVKRTSAPFSITRCSVSRHLPDTPAIARLSANSGASDRYRDPRAAGLAVKLLSVAARSTSRRPARFSSFDPDRLRA